jgi:hypothetical protein
MRHYYINSHRWPAFVLIVLWVCLMLVLLLVFLATA